MKTAFTLIWLPALALCHAATAAESPAQTPAAGKVSARSGGLHGYIGCHAERPPRGADNNAGISFYSAIWPLIDRPLANFQIGLAGTWITPDNSDNKTRRSRRPAPTPAAGRNGNPPLMACSRPLRAVRATGRATVSVTLRRSSA